MSGLNPEYVERTFLPLKDADIDRREFDHGTEIAGSYKPTKNDGFASEIERREYLDLLLTREEQGLEINH